MAAGIFQQHLQEKQAAFLRRWIIYLFHLLSSVQASICVRRPPKHHVHKTESKDTVSCPIQRTILDFSPSSWDKSETDGALPPSLSFYSRRQNIGYRARKIMVSFWREGERKLRLTPESIPICAVSPPFSEFLQCLGDEGFLQLRTDRPTKAWTSKKLSCSTNRESANQWSSQIWLRVSGATLLGADSAPSKGALLPSGLAIKKTFKQVTSSWRALYIWTEWEES